MENITPEIQPPEQKTTSGGIGKYVYGGLIFGVLIVVGALLYFLPRIINQSNSLQPKSVPATQTETTTKGWEKPVSVHQGLPLLNDGKLFIYSIDKKQSTLVKDSVYDGGESGRGSTGVLQSPDLLYSIFIDKDNQLILLSNDTLEQKIVTKKVKYFSGWAPNSEKFVYYVEPDNIATRTENEMGADQNNTTEKFSQEVDDGYFLFDINTGKIQKLPLTYFETFIDNNRILTKTDGNSYNYVVFDITTFTADYQLVKDTFQFGSGQFSFTKDGKQWVFTDSFHPTSDDNIVLANFPNRKGIVIESAAWAYVQGSMISQDGHKVVYQHRAGMSDGVPDDRTLVYDVNTKTKKELGTGNPRFWINNDKVLFSLSSDSQTQYAIADVNSGAIEKINLPK